MDYGTFYALLILNFTQRRHYEINKMHGPTLSNRPHDTEWLFVYVAWLLSYFSSTMLWPDKYVLFILVKLMNIEYSVYCLNYHILNMWNFQLHLSYLNIFNINKLSFYPFNKKWVLFLCGCVCGWVCLWERGREAERETEKKKERERNECWVETETCPI